MLLLPAVAALVWLLLLVLPRLDPRRAAYPAFAGTLGLFTNVVVPFLAGLLIAAVGLLLPPPFGFATLLGGSVGVSVLLTGYSYLLWRRRPMASRE